MNIIAKQFTFQLPFGNPERFNKPKGYQLLFDRHQYSLADDNQCPGSEHIRFNPVRGFLRLDLFLSLVVRF
ncbi:Uncharacterised protein [Mycobacteroides abscessus subsp. abscessus]|nr:Uncharacterised protein [Mycobacteroides abscessus subsp. abscessus]